MSERFNKVWLVLDRNYGQRLRSLVDTGPVWIIDTEANQQAAGEYWQLTPHLKPEESVTTFTNLEDDSPSAACLKILSTVDLHHAEYSGGYSVIEIIGAHLNQELRSALEELGFNSFEPTEEGFRASR